MTNILSLDERRPFTEAFETVRGRVESAANADRVASATAIFKEKIDANETEIQETLRRIDIAIEGLSRSGNCSWDGNAIDGPTLLNHVSDAFKIAHTKLQSSAMLHRLQNRGIGGSYSIGFSAPTDDPWSTKSRELTQAFLDRIAKLIKAESQSVPDEKAREHYFAMLTTLADIDNRLNQNEWTNATQKGLSELTRKANLSLQVTDYDSATSELLYWKEQFAAAQAKKIASHAPLPTICKERLSNSPQQLIGLYTYQPDDPGRPRILSAIPDLVPLIAKSMGNAKVVASGVRKLDSSKPTWMSQFQAECIAS